MRDHTIICVYRKPLFQLYAADIELHRAAHSKVIDLNIARLRFKLLPYKCFGALGHYLSKLIKRVRFNRKCYDV